MTAYWLEHAWLGSGRLADHVLVTVDGDRLASVEPDIVAPPASATRLRGFTIPGLANCHSHAFHRALRGRTQEGRGTFWTWRDQMYAVAERLDPDSYYALARATYAEMAATGITCVGEFHYLHHDPAGHRYDDHNVMGRALIAAARDAGLRIALLDTCYLAAGIDRPAEGVQRRFSDGDIERWAQRVDDLRESYASDVVVGAAIHSVRAVPRDGIAAVARWAHTREAPLHFHLSEQLAENDGCEAAYGMSPTRLLFEAGALGPRSSAVHATHLSDADVALLGGSQTYACFCPTTERDLADGVGRSRDLQEAGARLSLGSDSHAVIDMFEEMRAVELDERLTSSTRGHWSTEELLTAATGIGHASLGFANAGTITPGAFADLVTLDASSPRTAGVRKAAELAVFAASAADVTHVVSGGRAIDSSRVGRELAKAIGPLWEDA
ncbi:MAG: formimidoylglutamate deiminase [Propionibacteriales bacterium]|nr:formimidoylglutamate deiminase [Propionibacteriales bacterium]